jgi:hypothetical protein
MLTLNPALFEPLKRIENAARRASGVLLTAPDVSTTKDRMIAKEIQEMRDVLQAFQTAIEAGDLRTVRCDRTAGPNANVLIRDGMKYQPNRE